MEVKKIGLCADHAGFETKEFIKGYLESKGYAFEDFGTFSTDSCDYADYAHNMANAMERGECYPGIAVCGSGNGINMTLNKHQSIRAALCWDVELAKLAREHNDANVLTLPGRFIDFEKAAAMVDIFLATAFEGGRHQARIDKIAVK